MHLAIHWTGGTAGIRLNRWEWRVIATVFKRLGRVSMVDLLLLDHQKPPFVRRTWTWENPNRARWHRDAA